MKGTPVFAFCAVVLLGFIPAIARSEDSGPLAGSASAPESSPSRPIGRFIFQSDIDAAWEKPLQLLKEDKTEEAVAAQRQYISMLCDRDGKTHWEVRTEECLLSEMQRVAQLSRAHRRTYVTARMEMLDALQRLNGQDYDNAAEIFAKDLAALSGVLGENSLSSARVLEGMALAYLAKQDPSKAKEYSLRCAAAYKAVVGDQHSCYSNALIVKGGAHRLAGEFEQAEAAWRAALPLERKAYGARSMKYAGLLVKLTTVMVKRKKWPEAEAFCTQAMSIADELQMHGSQLEAAVFYNMADIEIAYEDYESAEDLICRSLAIYERALPAGNVVIPQVLDRYGWLLRKLDRPEEAAAVERRAESLRAQIRLARERMKATRT